MAQTTSNATDIAFTNEGAWTTVISQLRSFFVPGSIIYASHITYLKDRMNEMIGHYHQYTDYYQIATFGSGYGDNPSAGDRSTYVNSSNFTATSDVNTISATYSSGSQITTTDINPLAFRSRDLVDHTHQITDRISI